ncbi:hypothetical protein OG883_31065 [Streptomyces sp. NBC_01142]|uniref:hypothetical protein n=1 Tax=Streptomyces sp. NBC_01142 TaxID=2975865 RepID=UPI002258DC37|nr:hypothetical protein [Streptomyces sp. NBC_01142]MCX4824220.1 hypothetical protein [Streptomyces sp. NBC_01142]
MHPTSGPRTSASAFSSSRGLLPTPTTSEWNGPGAPDGNRNDTLRARNRQLPTPRARDSKGVGYEDGLPAVVQLLKTPTAQLGVNGGSQHPDKRKQGGHGPTLADEVEHLLPTATVADSRGTRNRRRDGTPYSPGYGETLTDATALLPTPRASDTGTPGRRAGEGFRPPLSEVVLPMFPTPRASDGTKASPNQKFGDGTPTLASAAARLLPTPQASDHGSCSNTAEQRQAAGHQVYLSDAIKSVSTGAATPPPSSGGKRSRADRHPGQLTIEAA